MTPTAEQQIAIEAVLAWMTSGKAAQGVPGSKPYMTLGGLAGSGKSFLISHLVALVPGVQVLAPTGKAAQVLRRKGVDADTVHSWLYGAPEEDHGNGDLVWGEPRPPEIPSLIVVDESSMVYTELFRDLMSVGAPVLFVGDHGQLEPVGDNPNLMTNPDLKLETIMRQALDSPILSFAHTVRTGGALEGREEPGLHVVAPLKATKAFLLSFDQVIVAFNRVRQALNIEMRGAGPLRDGDKVICLRNDRRRGLFNGQMGHVSEVHATGTVVTFDFLSEDGRRYPSVTAWCSQFGAERTDTTLPRHYQLFDFGSAVTAHKSQGSEWPNVLVVEGWCKHWSMERWRYTAATRAAKSLTYVSSEVGKPRQVDLFGDAA